VHSFRVDGADPEAFVARVRGALARHRYDDIASVRLDGARLVVCFRRLGTTTLQFELHRDSHGFDAEFVGSRVAPLHAPFQGAFEERFEDLLAGVGARVATDRV